MHDFIQFLQHHSMQSLALLIVLILLFFLELARLKQKAAELSPAEVTRLINRQNAVVVDLRNQEAFTAGHIVDAICLPLNELKDKQSKLEKYKNDPIILVCSTGMDSARTALSLKDQGYNVHVLNGGIPAWRRAELPLVKG